MNEWFKNMIEKAKGFWKGASIIKKVIVVGIAVALIALVCVAVNVNGSDSTVRVFPQPVTDETKRDQILDRISQENIKVYVTDEGVISVEDEKTARKVRSILGTEGLLPSNYDRFASFYNRSITTTDQEQRVKLKNALTQELKRDLEALSDVGTAWVTIVQPDEATFKSDQNPVTCSVQLKFARGSDAASNRRKIKGIQDYILTAVEGLVADNLTIIDYETANVLNDFEGMAENDRIDGIKKQQKLIESLEAQLENKVLKALKHTYSDDRIQDVLAHYEMDMSEKNSESTIYSPIILKEDNPDTPYDDSEMVESIKISGQDIKKKWEGTGYNPEGPAGVEGQTPPVYSDMSNVIGQTTEEGYTYNNVVNTTHTTEKVAPQKGRITISANIDGLWKLKTDPKTHDYIFAEDGSLEREYTPISDEELAKVVEYVRAAVGYNRNRGDIVTVTNIPFDHSVEFAEFDAAYIKKIQTRKTILLVLAAVAVVLVGFILFRIISKEIERRRRAREEELLRQQQLAREQALWEAKDEAQTVTMSVEESRRAELQENAINMAKEHPEDVAMLIRTWLMEE